MSGKFPRSFKEVDKNVQFVCKLCKIILDKVCYLGGSYINGFPALDSDIDIYLEQVPSKEERQKMVELSSLLGVKIDLGVIGKSKYYEVL